MRRFLLITAIGLGLFAAHAQPAVAGCGCNKPAPPLESIRPHFAPAGSEIVIFDRDLVEGQVYSVRFKSWVNPKLKQTVNAAAVSRRDFADALYKVQLRVMVPPMPLGPTYVEVKLGKEKVVELDENQFTVLAQPIVLREVTDVLDITEYHAAVDTHGVVYLAFDISDIADETLFSGIGFTYPLLFDAQDVAIYNRQGFLMQLLGPDNASIFSIDDEGSPDSFRLTYDRHEFNTYRQSHVDDPAWRPDPQDAEWHADGTPHIDHDHLIIAISGVLETGEMPETGATPVFDLSVTTAVNPALGDPSAPTPQVGP